MQLPDKKHSVRMILLLLVLGFVVYAYSFQAGFQYDDYKIIVENPVSHHVDDIKFIWNYDPTRFLVHLSFAVNFAISQFDVFSYHLVNLTLHILCAFVVFIFLRIALESNSLELPASRQKKDLIASFAAVIFLVHPLQTEAVTYIVQRSTVLASLLYLSSILFYMLSRIRKQNAYYYASLFFALLGAMSKPVIITLPLAIILIEFTFLGLSRENFKQRIKMILPFFAVIFLVMFFILLWRYDTFNWKGVIDVTRETDDISRSSYFLTQFNVIMLYIFLLFFPFRQNLDYDFKLATSLFESPTIFSFIIIAGILFLAFRLFRRRRLLAFSLLWFFICLIPESSIFPISDLIFEHRLYLSMIGFSLFITISLCALITDKTKCITVLVLFVALLSFLTVRRNYIWADQERLLNDTIAKSPKKARPMNNLGDVYLRRGQLVLAEEKVRLATQIEPDNSKYYYNLGVVLERQKKFNEAKMMYHKAVTLDTRRVNALYFYNLGHIYTLENNITKAELYYLASIEANPKLTGAYCNLGNLYAGQERFQEAVSLYKKAMEINPYELNAYNGLASSYSMMKKYNEAIKVYRQVLYIRPNFSTALNNLGNVYVLKKDLLGAELVFRRAIEINPDDAAAYRNLANVYYGLKRNKEAEAHIRMAVRLLDRQGQEETARKLQARFLKKEE